MEMIRGFGGRNEGSPYERLATLKQEGDMEEYVRRFEVLIVQVLEIPEDQILSYFMGGLKDEIKK